MSKKKKETITYKGKNMSASKATEKITSKEDKIEEKIEAKESIQETIAKIAKSYIGQEEIKGNQGFKDSNFQKKMEDRGWLKGEAWCALAIELVYVEAYPDKLKELEKLFSKSAVKTYHNFASSDWITDQKPEVGALIVWQNYKRGEKHWTGHIGVIVDLTSNSIIVKTVEGNTNKEGKREGEVMTEKTRTISYIKKHNGLNLLGIIHPKEE